ncbi:hypothetical protein [Scytonema sp. UIC 10036]|nr:hypothetical protein [Scytonema sp. UIC 10036]
MFFPFRQSEQPQLTPLQEFKNDSGDRAHRLYRRSIVIFAV